MAARDGYPLAFGLGKSRRLSRPPAPSSGPGARPQPTACSGGGLVQLRALDWDENNPIKDYAMVVVYHPESGQGHAWANVGYPSFVGTMTAYSSQGVGISEKVWLTEPQGADSRLGEPWTFVLRETAQQATDLDSALELLASKRKTCSIHVGVGSRVTGQLRHVHFSHGDFANFTDRQPALSNAQHPVISEVVYVDKHSQRPTNSDDCLSEVLKEQYGHLDGPSILGYVTAWHETGDTQVCVMDMENDLLYIAYAAKTGAPGPIQAYTQPFTRLNATDLWNMPAP
eukprot:gene1081-2641_t